MANAGRAFDGCDKCLQIEMISPNLVAFLQLCGATRMLVEFQRSSKRCIPQIPASEEEPGARGNCNSPQLPTSFGDCILFLEYWEWQSCVGSLMV